MWIAAINYAANKIVCLTQYEFSNFHNKNLQYFRFINNIDTFTLRTLFV